MARQPIHIEASGAKGSAYGRQAMWEALRKSGTFTVPGIARKVSRANSSVREYVKRLLAAGIVVVERPSEKNGQSAVYRLIDDRGHEAPRLTPDGKPRLEARDQMWLTMKMLANFNFQDLAAAASTEECPVSPTDAADYCKHLLRAGYLVALQAATHKSKAVYRLLPSMNTGPHAPMVQRTKCVFDPNRNRIMWHEELEP